MWRQRNMNGANKVQTGRRSKVIDLRGQTLTMLEPADLPAEASKDLRQAVQRANLHRWTIQLKYAVGMFAVLAGIGLVANWLFAATSVVGLSQSVVQAVGSLFFGTLGGAAAAKENGVKAVARCLKAEICPSCGYSLRDLAVESDGGRVCPECGGVWRVG